MLVSLSHAGVAWKKYRYYDPKTIGFDFEGAGQEGGEGRSD